MHMDTVITRTAATKMDTALTVSIVSRRAVLVQSADCWREERAAADSSARAHEPVVLKLFSKRSNICCISFRLMGVLSTVIRGCQVPFLYFTRFDKTAKNAGVLFYTLHSVRITSQGHAAPQAALHRPAILFFLFLANPLRWALRGAFVLRTLVEARAVLLGSI